MAMEENLIARLTGSAAISGIVGDRISWFDRNRGDNPPSISLTKVSPGREWTHDGPDNLDRPRVQFDCWGSSDEQAAALSREVLGVMEQAQVVGGTRFHPAMLDSERWDGEGEQAGGEPLFRVSMDFVFFHEELN